MSLRSCLIALFVATSLPAQDSTILVRGARVFDGVQMLGERDVLVRGGRISALGQRLDAPPGASIVEARGKTLLPGFIDAHTHTFGDVLTQALAFGVTTQLEQFTDPAMVRRWHDEQRTGKANSRADVFSAGVLVTAPGGHGTQFGLSIPTITSPDSAQAFVDARIAEGADWIKIVYDDGRAYALNRPTLDSATMHAVVAAAHKRGKLAIVHVHSASFARSAIAAGADGLVHVFADTDSIAEFVALAKRRGAFVIPTLASLVSGGAPSVAERLRSAVATLHSSGVRLVFGTDVGVLPHGQNAREFSALAEAGIPPIEAIRAATANAAAALGLTNVGLIEPGGSADLIAVDGDPVGDVTSLSRVVLVMRDGAIARRPAPR